ncbi:vacuolar alkaline phosphatase [Gonapodya sp. JEL0774]|nr:vacuolar alkaline phosphatase [Gonapodya sp. JEL0774]
MPSRAFSPSSSTLHPPPHPTPPISNSLISLPLSLPPLAPPPATSLQEAPLVNHPDDMDAVEAALKEQKRRRSRTVFGITASICVAVALTWAIVGGAKRLLVPPPTRPSLILIIPDGFGPASITMARSFGPLVSSSHSPFPSHSSPSSDPSDTSGLSDPFPPLPMDAILVGTARTRSSSSLVTDSAAGATAYACGVKSYNGAIAVDPFGVPCGTVLEAAHEAGLKTGLVATSRITHATPASFNAHVLQRDSENLIAEYQVGLGALGRTTDLMFGGGESGVPGDPRGCKLRGCMGADSVVFDIVWVGHDDRRRRDEPGRCHFLPSDRAESCRLDDKDLLKVARERGFSVLTTREDFDGANYSLPVLGVFTPDHMSYTIDRDPVKEPSVAEMAVKALEMLTAATQESDKGFFLMVECSRIDAVAEIKSYVNAHPGTVMVIVADHETGGMTLGRQTTPAYPTYQWQPSVLLPVLNSSEILGSYLLTLPATVTDLKARRAFVVDTVIKAWMGITDATDDEIKCLVDPTGFLPVQQCLAEMVSVRAFVGWSTHGHTGVDVNLYAHGLQSEKLRGNHENTDVANFIRDFLGLSLEPVTEKLKNSITQPSTRNLRTNGESRFKEMHYHHV